MRCSFTFANKTDTKLNKTEVFVYCVQVVTITPNESNNESCSSQCFTFTKMNVLNLTSNSTLDFQPGTYNLTKVVTFQDVRNISLKSSGAEIMCFHGNQEKGAFVFLNVTNVRIDSLTFTGCGAHIDSKSEFDRLSATFPLGPKTKATLWIINSSAILISNTTAQNNTDYGLLSINTGGGMVVTNSTFQRLEILGSCVRNNDAQCPASVSMGNVTHSMNKTCDCEQKPTQSTDSSTCNTTKHNITFITPTPSSCPVGFKNESGKCVCSSFLHDHGIKNCNVTNKTVDRQESVWVAAQNKNVLISYHCSPDHCDQNVTEVSLDSPDEQCAFNRTGIICGACQRDLSATLGSSQCLKCSNKYLALIVPFALMGVVLIILMLLLDLNVSVGAINGFILYANIVQENYVIFFFPRVEKVAVLNQILTIFISWPNLDFGIQTCFYNGMDAYSKMWLELVYPVYLCTLAVILVLICKHVPTRFKKYLGRPSAAIFATLLLMSYAKLLRIVIATMSSIQVYKSDGTTVLVWLYDGNIPFLSGKHVGLFVIALLLLLAFIIPYTIVLVFAPCLQSLARFKVFRWVDNKNFKPLLDAYQVPFKRRAKYWPGLMILVRLGLFTSFAVTAHFENTQINLMVIATTVICILTLMWLVGTVYKSFTINLAEAAFIFNLGVLSIWSLYGGSANISSPNQYILTYTMVSIAMVKFALVIAYHIYHSIDWLWEWVKEHREKQNDESQVHLFTISDMMSGTLSSEIDYVEPGTSTFLPVEKVEGEVKESKSAYIPVSVILSTEGKGEVAEKEEVDEKGGEVKDETD